MLLSRSGTVVTREELQRKLFTWRFGEVKPTPRPECRFWPAPGACTSSRRNPELAGRLISLGPHLQRCDLKSG